MIDVDCKGCGKAFQARKVDIRRGYGKYCSRSCANQHIARKRKKAAAERFPNCVCATCGTTFYRSPSKIGKNKSGFTFCSRACKESAQRVDSPLSIAEIQPVHYGDGSTYYRAKALRIHGAVCARCGYDKYEKLLHVHHRDRDRTNASSENLEVLCVRCHQEDHLEQVDGWFSGSASLGK